MTSRDKGKGIAAKESRGYGDDDKSGGNRKRKNRGILQFFEEAADEVDDSDFDFDNNDFLGEDFNMAALPSEHEPAKSQSLPFIPKEEEMDEEEFDRMMEERYKIGSGFVTYAGDYFEDKLIEKDSLASSSKDPTIWKVKCMVGRERQSAFCLMQKFVDLKSRGTQLRIISAFSADHVKGFIYIEAERQSDVNEACKGLSSIYISRMLPLPRNEVSHVLSAQSKCNQISEGMWVRVKHGKYKGDLAQVVTVNHARKRVTMKLIPRINLQAMAAKFGGGRTLQKTAAPAPRLIGSSELEEFRPLIQYRHDRETGKVFEILDGHMLKDGYLYKKLSVDSLSFWGVEPTEEELLKFKPPENNESNDMEWLSQLYGEKKKKRIIRNEKGGEKGEGSSGSIVGDNFHLHDLVCFGRKDFGIIIGMEKDDSYKVLKEGPEGPVSVTVQRHELKGGPFDMKFTAPDKYRKSISVNETVRVLEGPFKDRQGMVKRIYRGVIFLYDENAEENGGFICSKSQNCEKIKLFGAECDKGTGSGFSGLEDFPSSPKSPLSPKRPWQSRENDTQFNRGDKDRIFSIGQTVRIKVGPLKGYICRVLAVRRADVTVKIDSQQKVLTVKCENLAEVQRKSFASSVSGDREPSSSKTVDLLGSEGGSSGWMDRVGTSTGSDGWNTGGLSAGRSAWANSFDSCLPPGSSENRNSWGNESKKGEEGTSWGGGSAVVNDGTADDDNQAGGWGTGEDNWNKSSQKNSESRASRSWCKALASNEDASWELSTPNQNSYWVRGSAVVNDGTAADPNQVRSWGNGEDSQNRSSSWNQKAATDDVDGTGKDQAGWNGRKSSDGSATGWGQTSSWKRESGAGKIPDSDWSTCKPGSGEISDNWRSAEGKHQGTSSWNQKAAKNDMDGTGKDRAGWNGGKSSNCSATGWGQTSSWKRESGAGKIPDSNWSTCKPGSGEIGDYWRSAGGKHQGTSSWNQKSAANDMDGTVKDQAGWNCGKSSNGSATGWGQTSSWKRESGAGKIPDSDWSTCKPGSGEISDNWRSAEGKHQGTSSWNQKAAMNDMDGSGKEQAGWNAGKSSDGSATGWGQTSSWKRESGAAKTPDSNRSIRKPGSGEISDNWRSAEGKHQGASNGWNETSDWKNGGTDTGKFKSDWKSSNPGSSGFARNQNSNWENKGIWYAGNEGSAGGRGQNSGWKRGSGGEELDSNDRSYRPRSNHGSQFNNFQGKKGSWGAGTDNAECGGSTMSIPENKKDSWNSWKEPSEGGKTGWGGNQGSSDATGNPISSFVKSGNWNDRKDGSNAGWGQTSTWKKRSNDGENSTYGYNNSNRSSDKSEPSDADNDSNWI